MNITGILLVITVSAVAHAATVRYDGKGTDSKKSLGQSEFQATKPSTVETSSRSVQEDMHLAQLKLQSNQIENSRMQNNNKFAYQSEMPTSQSFHSQDHFATDSPTGQEFQRDQSLFHSQQPGVPATTVSTLQSSQNDQFNDEFSFQPETYNDQQTGPNQQQFYNIEQQQQQFYNDKERASGEQQFFNKQQTPDQQQFYNNNQQSQEQQFFSSKQQEPNQEQFYNDKQQSQEQQQFFNNMHVVGVENQQFNNKGFQGISNQQSTQIHTGKHATQIQTQGVVQLSAFDNREQPIVLSRGAVQPASVLVSGLKNLPLLPAMVYNAGQVPSPHAIAYSSDPLYKGAAVRQHLQTPYVRYVYSHIL